MDKFEKKYGIIENEEIKKHHLSRRMWCIIDNKVHIAEPNLPYTHAVWFEKQGWISEDNDKLMSIAVRGTVHEGNIYFYSGYDFIINKEIESIFFQYLKQLVSQLGLSSDAEVYGGFRKDLQGKLIPVKFYGKVEKFLENSL